MTYRGHHGESEHDERDVPVPAVPGAGLVVGEPELRLGGLERVLDGPAPALHGDQRRDPGPGRAPGREVGPLAVGQAAAAFSFIVPQKPQASLRVAGIWLVLSIVGSLRLIVATAVVTR